MNGRTRILYENELLNHYSDIDAVFPVTSDTAVYNTRNVSISDYMPFINVHAFAKVRNHFTSKATARRCIDETYRHNGIILTYTYGDSEDRMWIVEQYNNSLIDDTTWSDDSNWSTLFGNVSSGTSGTLDTTSNTILRTGIESLSDDIKLHRVSKTGTNTDLVDFVGKRRTTVLNDTYDYIGGEIFSYYGNDPIERNIASGPFSSVFGKGNNTDNAAEGAFITGYQNVSHGAYSFISGIDNESYGMATSVFGKGNRIVGDNRGDNNVAKYSFVSGLGNTVDKKLCFVGGSNLLVPNENATVFGKFNKVYDINSRTDGSSTYLFAIGNGTSNTNRSNAVWIRLDGYTRFYNDVSCIMPDNLSRIHELSKKYDSSDLINNITYNTTVNGPVSNQALYELYRQFIGSHDAYFYSTISDFRNTLSESSETYVEYHEGDQIYITDPLHEQYEGIMEDLYPAFFIANVNDTEESYTYTTDDAYVADSNDSLRDSFYTIARLRVNYVSLRGYQKKLFDSLHTPTAQDVIFGGTKNIKTVGGVSLLIDNPDEDNINVLTETTDNVTNGNMLPVTSNAVYNFINNQTVIASNIKPLDTDNTESIPVNRNESLLMSDDREVVRLHKISKTGKNNDLVNYVGLRQQVGIETDEIRIGGEIFNSYRTNSALGSYSHVEGHRNSSTAYAEFSHVEGADNTTGNAYTHVGGKGNLTNQDYQTVIGKYALPFENPDVNQPLYPQFEYKNAQSVFTIGWGNNDSERSNIFNVSKTGHVWSAYKVTIGNLDRYGVPDITDFGNNDLVTKYYVDNVALNGQSQLYKGWIANYNTLQTVTAEAGTLYAVGSNTIEYENNSVTKANLLHLKYGNDWYKMYDIIAFSNTPVTNDFYVVGGTKSTNRNVNSVQEPILLHKIAKTGDYRDLLHAPSVIGFPSIGMKFVSYKVDANCTDTIYGTSINRFNTGDKTGEPETTSDVTQTGSISEYYDSKIQIVFDCDPQWVLDNIVNNADCKYYVQLQRVAGNKWKTIKDYTQSQHQQGLSNMYRHAVAPLNMHTLTPLTELHTDENGYKTLVDPYKLISYQLPYTVRDILMTFAQFKQTAKCLWDVLYLGTSPKTTEDNYKNMCFAGKPVYMKGLNSLTTAEEVKWLNAFAASFRLGVVEYPNYNDSGIFYGPSYWNNFKAMFKYDKVFHTLRCSGKFTNNRIKI